MQQQGLSIRTFPQCPALPLSSMSLSIDISPLSSLFLLLQRQDQEALTMENQNTSTLPVASHRTSTSISSPDESHYFSDLTPTLSLLHIRIENTTFHHQITTKLRASRRLLHLGNSATPITTCHECLRHECASNLYDGQERYAARRR